MTIDLTSRYNNVAFMRGGTGEWANNPTLYPVSRGIIHHTAGFYGRTLGTGASEAEEVEQIDALASDHFTRFGIGPGYNYLAFPSGRLYAVGKWGTHRAHTKGRDPLTGEYHNRIGIAICAMGNYEDDKPSAALLAALDEGIHEVEDIAARSLPWTGHGATPTVTAAGVAYVQGTACPGQYLTTWLASRGGVPILPPPASSLDWGAFWRNGAVPVRVEVQNATTVKDIYEVHQYRKVKP